MSGFGNAPLGASPFGIGEPETADPPEIAADAGARYLDPITGDYAIDASSGRLARMPAARQRVLLALRTEVGTAAAAADFGIVAPRKNDAVLPAISRLAVHEALRHLTSSRAIEIMRIDTEADGERGAIHVLYRDLETNTEDTVTV
jgi:hypothetical protein